MKHKPWDKLEQTHLCNNPGRWNTLSHCVTLVVGGTKESAFHLFSTTQEVSPNRDVVVSEKNKNALNTDDVVSTPERKLKILPVFCSPLCKWRLLWPFVILITIMSSFYTQCQYNGSLQPCTQHNIKKNKWRTWSARKTQQSHLFHLLLPPSQEHVHVSSWELVYTGTLVIRANMNVAAVW